MKVHTLSAAANPVNSVPAYENPAKTNTKQAPWKPLLNDPGSCQNLVSYLKLRGPPPRSTTIPRIINPISASNLMTDNTNSISPYTVTPAICISATTAQNTAVTAGPGSSRFQNRMVSPAAMSSTGNITIHCRA